MQKSNVVVLSADTSKLVTDWSDLSNKVAGKKTKMLDAMFADGIRAAMCFAPKKGEDRAFYDSLQAAVVLGFTKAEQKILNTERKDLSEDQKITRRVLDTKVSAALGDIRKGLTSRETSTTEGGAQDGKTSWEAALKSDLETRLKQAKAKESTTVKDLVGLIKDLESAISRI